MKEQKRVKSNLIVLVLFACGCASLDAQDREPVMGCMVFGTLHADFMASRQTIESPANHWKPGQEPFPIDVGELARRAKQHLLRRRPDISGTVNWISTEIRPFTRKTFPSPDVPEATAKTETVAWYLVFIFSARLPNGMELDAEERTVGMMLDGTILVPVKRTP